MTDRVTFSHGITRPGPEQFSSDRFDLAVETDVRPNETAKQAMERAQAFIMGELARIAAGTPSRPAVQDEAFDPSNPVHVDIARMVLDNAGVDSEAKRGAKIHKVFPGVRVGDLADALRKDEEAYRASRRAASGGARPFSVAKNDGTKSGWDGRYR